VKIEELQRLASTRQVWPDLDGYDILHGLVFGGGRCLDDPRFLTNKQQEQWQVAVNPALLAEIDIALAARAERRARS